MHFVEYLRGDLVPMVGDDEYRFCAVQSLQDVVERHVAYEQRNDGGQCFFKAFDEDQAADDDGIEHGFDAADGERELFI